MTRNLRRNIELAGAVTALGVAGILLARRVIASISTPPENLGVKNGRLAPCPYTPYCITSQADDPIHKIAPLAYTSSTAQAKATLKRILSDIPGVTIVADLPDYLYVETRSRILGFVADNEFFFDEEDKLIHIRAAARLEQGELGGTRKRVEAISKAFYIASQ
jgi:uncharacterized protein (DUF1499 family)